MRLIDADYVLGALAVFNDRKNGDAHFFSGIDSAREIVENAPAADPSGWIPCSERQPTDTRKPYDVTAEINVFGEKMLATDVLRYRGDGKWQDFEGSDGLEYKIVAWKERPAPWSGEVKEATNG